MDALMELERLGYSFTVSGETISYRWTRQGRPPKEAALLLQELRRQKAAALAVLRQRGAAAAVEAAPGVVVRLYPMPPACVKAGHCLALTRQLDCRLYPVRPGWCRGRVETRRELKPTNQTNQTNQTNHQKKAGGYSGD